jgi:hypothetical protein
MTKYVLLNMGMDRKIHEVIVLLFFVMFLKLESIKGQPTSQIFIDNFDGTVVNSARWHIPTWVSPTDGTYLGRTQFRCTPASLPAVISGEAVINVETFNPTGFSFYGTDLISNRSFIPGNGLIFIIRAKMKAPVTGGIVGGIFLYDLTCSCGAIHDEIDFELVTNDINKIHTNIYSDEPLGTGHPESVNAGTPVTDYHTYVMKWFPTEVIWSVDGNIIRTYGISPGGPMHFHLNIWVPGVEWLVAYNDALQPETLPASNQISSMIVDYVRVDSLMAGANSIVDEFKSEKYFYPNPAHDMIYFSDIEPTDVRIYNTYGDIVTDRKDVTGNFSVAGMSPGLYLIKYEADGVIKTEKLIIR